MNRNVSATARILGVDVQQVKTWAWLFKEHLNPKANPPKGSPRCFTDSDVLALIHVGKLWKNDPDVEAISIGLNSGDHHHDEYRHLLYRHAPLLQEPPAELDETWRHGILLNGGGVDQYLELARNYKQSAETLLESALKSGEPLDWGYPVLFAYRHTLELYLKIIGEIQERTHSLEDCVRLVEKRHGKKIASPIREWIIELDKIDPYGTAFRYSDDQAKTLTYAEYWVDFLQLKYALDLIFQKLDYAILRAGVMLTGRMEEPQEEPLAD